MGAIGSEYSGSVAGVSDLKKTKAEYRVIYKKYHSSPKAVQERSQRNKARRKMKLKVGDGMEVDHKNPISKGGSNRKDNLRIVTRATNRKKSNK